MRVTIVPGSQVVAVDGYSVHGLDLSSIPQDVHAVQWYGDAGDVEIVDVNGRMVENRAITSLSDYQTILDYFFAAKRDAELEEARILEEQSIIEV